VVGLGLFVLYHPLNALTFYKAGNPTFFDRRFLTLAAFLGVTCTITYWLTCSVLLIAMIHWLVVWIWLRNMGGWQRISASSFQSAKKDLRKGTVERQD
jgi:predicted Abi (CAAX) family protease